MKRLIKLNKINKIIQSKTSSINQIVQTKLNKIL